MAFIDIMLNVMLVSATPIILAATGLAYCERAGVLNIGIEGIMLLSASIGFTATAYSGNILIGFISGVLAGGGFGLILAILSVYLKVDQTVLGIGFWLFGMSFSSYFWWITIYPLGLATSIPPLGRIVVPVISDAPIIGVFFQQSIITYAAIALAIISYFVLTKTSFGLRLRATGDNPLGYHIIGGNVSLNRCAAMIISGVLGGFAGTFYTLGTLGTWTTNVTAGQGFIAIAIIKLVNWNPISGIFGSFVFASFISFQFQLQLSTDAPYELLLTIPYVASLFLLIIIPMFVRKSKPKSLGVPFTIDEG